MSFNLNASNLKNMDMMSSIVPTFLEEPSSRYSVLVLWFISDFLHEMIAFIDQFDVINDRHDVDDWLCFQSWDRRAADVVNGDQLFAEDKSQFVYFFLIHPIPLFVVWGYFNFSHNQPPIALASATVPINIISLSDLFHKDIPIEFIQEVFITMEKAH